MDKSLLTIAEIAKELQIPESTVRYYRDRFINYIPYVGEGRGRRYRPETVEVLRFIAEGFNRGLTAIDIEEGLIRTVAKNVEMEEEDVMTTAVAQQQQDLSEFTIQVEVGEQFQELIKQMNMSIQLIVNQKEEINDLRKTVAELRNHQNQQQQYIEERLNKRDEELVHTMKEILETRKQVAAIKEQKIQKKWWQFWK
jgi:DNA-binding transcriptional MerR regulator